MGFKTDMVTDLKDSFFNKKEFAEDDTTVIITHAAGGSYEVAGIFDNEFESVDPETGNSIISTDPIIRLNENDLQQEIKKGDKIIVRKIVYDIWEKRPDGVGTILLALHKEKV